MMMTTPKAWRGLAMGCLVAALPLIANADAPPPPPGAAADIGNRFYIAPLGSYTFVDGGRQTDDGYGGTLAIGKQLSPYFNVELSGQYGKLSPATLYGAGVNGLFFPTRGSLYALGGAAYGKVRSHPGNDADYGTVLLNLGGGWLWKPFHLLGTDIFLRTEALYRLDAHNDRRTGSSVGNGRKAFDDFVLNVGFLIPLGSVPPPPAAPAPAEEPAQVVPVEEPAAPAEPAAAPCPAPLPGQAISADGCGAGDTIVLRGVNFATDKSLLTANAKAILDPVAEALKARPEINVEVGGHTDSQGSATHNQGLSERRAKAVMDYLVDRGVETARLSSHGYGKNVPIADNTTEAGRAQNRRVELKISGSQLAAPATEAAPPATDAVPPADPAPAADAAPPAEEAAPAN